MPATHSLRVGPVPRASGAWPILGFVFCLMLLSGCRRAPDPQAHALSQPAPIDAPAQESDSLTLPTSTLPFPQVELTLVPAELTRQAADRDFAESAGTAEAARATERFASDAATSQARAALQAQVASATQQVLDEANTQVALRATGTELASIATQTMAAEMQISMVTAQAVENRLARLQDARQLIVDILILMSAIALLAALALATGRIFPDIPARVQAIRNRNMPPPQPKPEVHIEIVEAQQVHRWLEEAEARLIEEGDL